jgi:hypothetical protein
MRVHFSVVEEFLEELRHEHTEVEDAIVRVTFRYEQSPQVPFVYHMSVVAGFLVRGKLIELKQSCGDITKPPGEHDAKTRARAEQIAGQIENVLSTLNRDGCAFALRRGVFEL